MMQIKTMPTSTTLFKHKWNLLITKLSPNTTNTNTTTTTTTTNNKSKRRTSNSSEEMYKSTSNNNPNQKRRKHSSDAVSVGTFESTISMADKFRQVIPFFRRRSTSHIGSNTTFEESAARSPTTAAISPTNTAATAAPSTSTESYDFPQELEKLKSLYTLAVDELFYAEDSQGSSYYSGDLVTAREALDDCANAFMQLLQHTTDPIARKGLQSLMAAKLLKLQEKLKALPKVDEEDDYY